MTRKKGYSLIVLIIAIAVILILASVSITALRTSRETIASSDYIYDMKTVQEMLQQYYVKAGTLPVISEIPLDDVTIPNDMKSQLDPLDNENYYNVDLGKIGNNTIRNRERGYIVNEKTLKVYSLTPLEYNDKKYHTLTDELMGIENDYQFVDEEVTIVGNPTVWVERGRLRVILPRKALEGKDNTEYWKNWEFKWDFGSKTIEEMRDLIKNYFEYGDTLVVKTNGVYTIYILQKSEDKEMILKVNVDKVDDIKPAYNLDNAAIQITDDQTGIAGIYYKTLNNYIENKIYAGNLGETEDAGRTELDFYLIDGKGKDLFIDMKKDVVNYNAKYTSILEDRQKENERFSDLSDEEKVEGLAEHEGILSNFDDMENALRLEYPYLADIYATTQTSQLVLYIEDKAGNAVVIGDEEIIGFDMLTKAYSLGTVLGN